MTTRSIPRDNVAERRRREYLYAAILAFLTMLFALRVAGQAIQKWAPQSFLPPFQDFQGSNLPYGILLTSQLVILTLMVRYAWRTGAGALQPSRRAGVVLAWLGGAYMVAAVSRIAIGLFVSGAAPWFTAWISGALHVALAFFVVTLAHYHLVGSRPAGGRRRE